VSVFQSAQIFKVGWYGRVLLRIAAAAKAYRVVYSEAENKASPGDYSLDHSALVYLMDQEGKYLAHFASGTTAEQIAENLGRFL
jgi:protein SCO1